MPRRGIVQLTTSHLAARCSRCGKHIAYKSMDPPMTLAWWDAVLKAFIKKHNEECKLPEGC